MLKYIARRLLMLIPVLLGVTLLVFSLMYITPGDPVDSLLGDNATPEAREALRPIIHRGRDGLRHCHRNFPHLANHNHPPRGAGGGRVGIHIRNNLRNGCSAQSVPQRALLRFVSVHDIYREKLWHTPLVRLAQRGNVRACVHGNGVREAAFYNRCCGRDGARRALLGSGGEGKTARMCRACVRSVKFA